MKKIIFRTFLTIVTIFVFEGCKKSENAKNQSSEWTFNGTTFKVEDAYYDDASNILLASDDAGAVGGGNYVSVLFGSLLKPTGSTTLTVANFGATSYPSNCEIHVGSFYGASQFYSTGKSGDKAILTVSSSGKLKVTFSNITVSAGSVATTKTVSGTLIEN